jgi:enediyne biosynthesis protein E5
MQTTTSAPDPRIKALRRFAASITIFTLLGHLWLGFEQAYLTPVVGLLTAYTTDLALETLEARMQRRPARYTGGWRDLVNFLLPSHIAGLACAMLLYGNSRLAPTAFATAVAVATKYVVRVRIGGRQRHILNPSNAGIALTLVLFPWVGIAQPYEFTENVTGILDWVIPLAILVSGTMLNAKLTRKMPLILAWVGGFVAQAVIRSLVSDVSLVGALLPITGTAFILFTNYMITDPGTTPFEPRRQVGFGLAVAAMYGVLVSLHITFGLFFALVLVCILRAVTITVRNRFESRTPAPEPVAAMPELSAAALGGGRT